MERFWRMGRGEWRLLCRALALRQAELNEAMGADGGAERAELVDDPAALLAAFDGAFGHLAQRAG